MVLFGASYSNLPRKLKTRSLSEWTNAYLRERAGHAPIYVEQRASLRGNYGKEAPRFKTTFGEFLTALENGTDEQ